MASLLELVKELRERTGAGIADCKKALEATDADIEKAIDWLREKGIAKSASKVNRIAAEGGAKVLIDGNKAVLVEVNSETDFTAKNDRFKNALTTVAEVILANNPADVETALTCPTAEGPLSEVLAGLSFATGEKITLRRFEVVEKTDAQCFGSYVHHDGKTGVIVVVNGDKADVAKALAMQVASMKPQYVSREKMPADIVEHEREVQTNIAKEDPSFANKKPEFQTKILEGRIAKALKEYCLVDQEFILDGSLTVEKYLKSNNCSCESFVRFVVGEGIEKKKDNWVEEVAASLKK